MKTLNLEQQLIFCEKYSINPSELLLLEILLLAQEGEQPEIVNKYFSSRMCARGNTRELLKGLQDAGVVLKSYKIPEKGQTFNPLDVPINKNLVKDFYKCSFDMGKELWDTYPQFGLVNGMTVGIRAISKKFNSPEDAFRYYGKSINWKPDLHNHIIELVEWGKENNLINCTLCNFMIDRKWEELEALRGGEIANIDFNAVKQL